MTTDFYIVGSLQKSQLYRHNPQVPSQCPPVRGYSLESINSQASPHAVSVTRAFSFPPKLFTFYFWLLWVFTAVCGLSLVVARGRYSSSQCAGFSLQGLLPRAPGQVGFSSCGTRGLSCSTASGIFPDQGSNQCLLHRQVDAYPLHRQGSLPAVL